MKSNNFLRISVKELISFILLLIFFVVCVVYKNHMMVNWLGIFCYIYCIYTWMCKAQASLFSPYFIFMTFFVLFNYGQPMMWAFNIHQANEIGSGILFYGHSYIPNENDLINVQLYICMCMLVFHYGVMLFTKRYKSRTIDRKYNENFITDNYKNKIKKSMRIVAGVLLIITTPIAIYSAMSNVIVARLYGYNALYYGEHATQAGYIQIIMYLFYPALVGCLIGCSNSNKSRIIVYSIFGIYALLQLLSGDRGSWLYSLVILVWLQTYYKKIPIRKYVKYIIMCIVSIYILNVVTAVRDSGSGLSSLDFSNLLNNETSPIVDAFFELGGTMNIITFLFHVGSGIYPYSNTYLTSILGAVSSRVLKMFGITQILIGDWFSQEYLKINWGAGFSMIGEAFLNGGYIGGLIYMTLIGAFLGIILNYANKYKYSNNPIELFITVAGLNAIVGFSRGALYLTLKELLYGTILVVICIKLCCRILNRSAYGKIN